MIEVRSAAEADKEDRRQKRILVLLFTLAFLGVGYATYDYLNLVDRSIPPADLASVDPFLERVKATGLVHSFDFKRALLVVNEDAWESKKRGEKIGIITQLARYCADKNQSPTWALTVKGQSTSATLGEVGPRGIMVN